MPRLRRALEQRELGYEAARLVANVAKPDTVDSWVTRAGGRTVRLLREEIDAAELLARFSNDSTPFPPSEAIMKEVAEFESSIVSGAVFARPPTETDETHVSTGTGQMFAPRRTSREARTPRGITQRVARGRVTLKFRVREGTYRSYRWLEGLFTRHRPARMSFLRFLCDSLIESWKQTLGANVAYGSVYARDRYRCTSPVCVRRDVTPHHLTFRAHGGDDSDENVTSLCVWCHLDGIHGGRLSASAPASHIEWTLGRDPHTVVVGRERQRRESAP
jgi:hypothetical protein